MHSRLLIVSVALLCAMPCAALKVTAVATGSHPPEFSWQLEPDQSSQTNLNQSAYRITVNSGNETVWDTAKVVSRSTHHIPYAGRLLAPNQTYSWKVEVWDQAGRLSSSQPSSFQTGLLAPTDWKAKWIAAQPDGPTPDLHMPVFRRSIRIVKPVREAIAYISGLGQYEFSINSHKVGDAVLAPGWTNYRKTIFYNTYDISQAIKPGDNALEVMLGSGFYNVPKIAGRYTKLTESFGQPTLILQIHLTFTDGGSTDIVTDHNWQYRPGPITTSHQYGGEDYDARLESASPQGWKSAIEVAGPGGRLIAQMSPDIRVFETFHAKPALHVYDLGQNFSGWPRITVRGRPGATVKLIPGELLGPDGLVSQRSSGGPVWFTYTLKGIGTETWAPRFSYYGFRYVQIEPADAEIISIEGQFVHSSAPVTGEFSCSRDLFNRIHKLIDAAILSNMQSVLTDCPHREKLGWLEESHLLGSAIMYNYGVERLYEKIASDIHDSQTPDGLVPDIAPEYTVFAKGFRDSPEWGSAVVLDPFLVYRHYGNRRNLAAHYDDMARYVAYLGSQARASIIAYGLGDWYDIGPKPPGVAQLTKLDVTGTAIYYADLITLRDIASLLQKTSDAQRYAREAETVRSAYSANVLPAATSQTAYAMPLVLGIAPAGSRAQLLDKLVADVKSHRNHTTAGDIGYHYVIQALSEGGRSDVIYDMLAATDAPSYAAQLAAGATTLTEAWDANPFSSQNHFMLGHAEEWFYRYLAGIDFDLSRQPDTQITLRPTPVGDLTWAKATLNTPLGRIVSHWQKTGGRIVYDCEVPVNARATVILPGGGGTKIIGSGRYHFEAQ